MRSVRELIMSLSLFILVISPIPGEDPHRLAGEIRLFGGTPASPLRLESDRDWIPVTAVKWEAGNLDFLSAEYRRKWRLRSSYEHEHAAGQVALQIRLRGSEPRLTFTHPWNESIKGRSHTHSNWFEEQGAGLIELGGTCYVEARLIAPPHTAVSGRLFEITLEAWQEDSADGSSEMPAPDVQLAYARPLPHASSRTRPTKSGMKASLDFALSFVEVSLHGDLASYFRLQADPVRSLDDGTAMAKYRLAPPKSIPGVNSIEDYQRRFDYHIYDSDTIRELFPEWFDKNRPWVPGENAFLFMGHRERLHGKLPEGIDYLVFVVEPDSTGKWRVVARPEQ